MKKEATSRTSARTQLAATMGPRDKPEDDKWDGFAPAAPSLIERKALLSAGAEHRG